MTAPRPARLKSTCSMRTRSAGCGAPRQQLHAGRHLREGRPLCRAHPSSRPAAPSAEAQGRARASGDWQRLSWDDALDETAEAFLKAERSYGAEAVWPYYYAGTMGLVMRDGINRLRHAKKYSGMYDTICVALSWPGYTAGTGRMTGADPREMQKSDLDRDLGQQPGEHPGQCDDPCGDRPQESRRQDRLRRYLRHRHHEAGGCEDD